MMVQCKPDTNRTHRDEVACYSCFLTVTKLSLTTPAKRLLMKEICSRKIYTGTEGSNNENIFYVILHK